MAAQCELGMDHAGPVDKISQYRYSREKMVNLDGLFHVGLESCLGLWALWALWASNFGVGSCHSNSQQKTETETERLRQRDRDRDRETETEQRDRDPVIRK